MIFQQCPICGRYMIPNMSETSGWYQCVCGYDSRSYVYTYTNHSSDFGYGEKERKMRLIDADELALKLRYMGYMDEHEEVQEVIDEAPTIDAVGVGRYEKAMQKLREMPRCLNGVKEKQIKIISADEVVRCKDCKWWELVDDYYTKGYGECTCPRSVIKKSTFLNEDWYCADGERKKE